MDTIHYVIDRLRYKDFWAKGLWIKGRRKCVNTGSFSLRLCSQAPSSVCYTSLKFHKICSLVEDQFFICGPFSMKLGMKVYLMKTPERSRTPGVPPCTVLLPKISRQTGCWLHYLHCLCGRINGSSESVHRQTERQKGSSDSITSTADTGGNDRNDVTLIKL